MQENVIKFSEVIGQRMDPFFYRNEFISLDFCLASKPYKKLEDLCYQITDGTHYTPSYVEQGVKFLSVKNVRENEIYFDKDTKYITKEEHEKLKKRAFPQADDILLTKIGATYGYAAVIPAQVEEFSIFVSLALLKVKSEIIDSKYLSIVLNSRIAKRQMDRVIKGVGVPDLHLEDIRNLKIPMIKNSEIVISIMDSAYKQKKDKELQGQNLLASIDDFVLDVLSINLPPFKKEKAYTIKISKILVSRYDPDYNQNYYQQLQMALENVEASKVVTLHSLTSQQTVDTKNCDFINYVDLGSIDEDTNTINYKMIESQDIPSRAKMHIAKGDFIFSGLAGSISSIALIDRQLENMVASTGFYVIKPSDEYNVAYLFALFKTKFMQNLLVRHASGAVMPSISNIELKNIKIPLPSKDIQDKIASYVLETIRKAKTLQEEANSGLEKAKQEVEKILLGE